MFESSRTSELNSRAPNDCAIVALSFAFSKDYETVRSELAQIAIELKYVWAFWKGTPHVLTDEYLKRNGWTIKPVPRKDNRMRMTGIVSAHKAGVRNGHMFCVINGLVFDTSSPNGVSLDLYLMFHKYHVRQLWMKG